MFVLLRGVMHTVSENARPPLRFAMIVGNCGLAAVYYYRFRPEGAFLNFVVSLSVAHQARCDQLSLAADGCLKSDASAAQRRMRRPANAMAAPPNRKSPKLAGSGTTSTVILAT